MLYTLHCVLMVSFIVKDSWGIDLGSILRLFDCGYCVMLCVVLCCFVVVVGVGCLVSGVGCVGFGVDPIGRVRQERQPAAQGAYPLRALQ